MKKNKNNPNNYCGDLFCEFNNFPETNQEGCVSNFPKNEINDAKRYIFKVSEINNILKTILEETFSEIWIEGEISNSKLHSSGHFYFSIKDQDSQLKAIMFKQLYSSLKFEPKDGMQILLKGALSCFVKAGTYQINVIYMEPKGVGILQLAFDQLKEKLFKEGLFDQAHKKLIPFFPQTIGIITSPTGAAIRDILAVLKRRYLNLHILIYPVKVQGDDAKFEIAEALKYFNSPDQPEKIDVILLGRGGGSAEDLWAFNEEIVARAVFDSRIPVISCVGHEIDFVISDFVADLRAPTPSAAAELLIKDKIEFSSKLDFLESQLFLKIKTTIDNYATKLNILSNNKFLKDPWLFLMEKSQILDYFTESLIKNITTKLDYFFYKNDILKAKLNMNSCEKILNKGYFILKDECNNILNLSKIDSLKNGDNIKIENKNYDIFCKILQKIKKT